MLGVLPVPVPVPAPVPVPVVQVVVVLVLLWCRLLWWCCLPLVFPLMLVWWVFVGVVPGVWVGLGGVGVVVVCWLRGGAVVLWCVFGAVGCPGCGGGAVLWWGTPVCTYPPGMFNAPPPVCCGGVGQ